MDKGTYINLRAKELDNLLVFKYLRLIEELKVMEAQVSSSDLDSEDKARLITLLEIMEEKVFNELIATREESEGEETLLASNEAWVESG